MQHKIRVSAIQRLCLQDGPGVRTTVFLKGCYLHCPWCCNPETIYFDKEEYFLKDHTKCGFSKLCDSCEIMGGQRDKGSCPFGAIVKTYTDYDTDELYSLILRDKTIYERGGGVTFSGGEPLFQAKQLSGLLKALKQDHIHIAFESSLFAPRNSFLEVKEFVDYWLVDVKFQFGFITHLPKDVYKDSFAENLRDLQDEDPANLKIRMVISHQAISKIKDIIRRFKLYNIKNVELLPCHQLGKSKYQQLSQPVPDFYAPTKEELDTFQGQLLENGILSTSLTL